jgi:hypothetical protein
MLNCVLMEAIEGGERRAAWGNGRRRGGCEAGEELEIGEGADMWGHAAGD